MRLRNHSALLIGALGITISARLVWPHYYANELREVREKATLRRALEIEAGWKLPPYRQMALPATVDAILSKIQWASLKLSETQQAKLKARVRELLLYFEQPTFEEYYRLKTEGFHYEFVPSKWASGVLAHAGKPPAPASGRAEPVKAAEACVNILWTKLHDRNGTQVLPRITAVSVDTVAGSLSRTNSGSRLLAGPVQRGFTIAMEAFEPGFRYIDEPDSNSAPLLFEFSFLARANASEHCGPMYISLIWEEKDQNWALNRLLLDAWLGFETLF